MFLACSVLHVAHLFYSLCLSPALFYVLLTCSALCVVHQFSALITCSVLFICCVFCISHLSRSLCSRLSCSQFFPPVLFSVLLTCSVLCVLACVVLRLLFFTCPVLCVTDLPRTLCCRLSCSPLFRPPPFFFYLSCSPCYSTVPSLCFSPALFSVFFTRLVLCVTYLPLLCVSRLSCSPSPVLFSVLLTCPVLSVFTCSVLCVLACPVLSVFHLSFSLCC